MLSRAIINAVSIAAISLLYFQLNAQTTTLGIPLGHNNYISSLHHRPNGILVSTSPDGTIKQWNIEKGVLTGNIPQGTPMQVHQSSASGISLTFLDWEILPTSHYILHNLNTNTTLACSEYANESNFLTIPFITTDGRYCLDKNQLIPTCKDNTSLDTFSLSFEASGISPTGQFIYHIAENALFRWSYVISASNLELDALSPVVLQDVSPNTVLNDIYYHSNGQFLFYKTRKPAGEYYQIWDANNGNKLADFILPDAYIYYDFHPTQHHILVAQKRAYSTLSFHRYNLVTEQIDIDYSIPEDEHDTEEFNTPAIFTNDGRKVLIGSLSGSIYVLDYENGQTQKVLKGHTSPIRNINLTNDEKGLSIVRGDGINRILPSEVIFWNFQDNNDVQQQFLKKKERYTTLHIIDPDDEPDSYTQFRDSSRLIASPDRSLFIEIVPPDYDATVRKLLNIRNKEGAKISSTLNFQARATADDDICTNAALSHDNSYIATGFSNGLIEVFSSAGKFLYALPGHTYTISDLVFTPDNTRLFSSSFDGSVKIWDLETKAELATLFLIDEEDWIVLGPNNLFDASPHAMNQMFYIVEKNGEKEIVDLEQMKSRYYEPGLLQKCLGFSNVPIRSVEGFDQVNLYPKVKTKRSGNQLHISLEERGGGIGRLAFYINGKEVNADVNPGKAQQFSISLDDYNKYFLYDNVIAVLAHNKEESLNSGLISKNYQYEGGIHARGWGNQDLPPLDKDDYLDSKLYVLTVGTSNYTGSKMDLKYADVDALLMAKAMKSVGGELFGAAGGVEVQCLTTTDTMAQSLNAQQIKWQFTTRENIQKALESISQQANPQDVVVVFFSGHGKTITRNNQPKFHYLTHEVSEDVLGDEKAIKNTTISSDELTLWLQQIPAYKQVLIIDACHSGKIIDDINEGEKELNSSQIRALDRMSDRAGLFIITGSAADKVSYEASSFGLGLLTYALLKGMNGTAVRQDNEGTKMIDVVSLFQYAKDEVQDLAAQINGLQRPELNFPLRAGSFDIGIYSEDTTIPLPDPKPVVIRGSFQNGLSFEDDLGLENELEKKYREESAKGIRARYLFKNLSDFPDAYQVRGQYTVADDGNISLKARLIQKEKSSVELDISDSPNVSILAKKINRAIKEVLASGLD